MESTKPLTNNSCPRGAIFSPPTYSEQTVQRYKISLPYFVQVVVFPAEPDNKHYYYMIIIKLN